MIGPSYVAFWQSVEDPIFSNNHSRKKKQKGVEKWERGVNLNPHCFLLISWCFATSRDGFLIVQIYLTRKHISIKIRIIAAQISFVSEISAESSIVNYRLLPHQYVTESDTYKKIDSPHQWYTRHTYVAKIIHLVIFGTNI